MGHGQFLGKTALQWARSQSKSDVVDYLEATIANKEAKSLHYAARVGDLDKVQRLIRKGAKIDERDNDGNIIFVYIFGS